MNEKLIFVIGASGVGKDTLIKGARVALQNNPVFIFPPRLTTCKCTAQDKDHIELTLEQFNHLKESDELCLHWEVLGVHYGLPNTIYSLLDAGKIVVVNGSREILEMACLLFPDLQLLEIIATEEVRMNRLQERGSSKEPESRWPTPFAKRAPLIQIDNSTSIEEGISNFISALHKVREV